MPEYWTKFLKTSSMKDISSKARELSLSKLRAMVLQFYLEKSVADVNTPHDTNASASSNSMIRFVTESML